MLAFGARLYIANLMAFLVIRADLLLVNAYRGTIQAGLYSVTVAVADALYVIPTAFALNLFPRVARGGTTAQSAEVFRKVAILFGGLCLLAALLARPAITLVYGSHFEPAVALFYWLVPGTFCLGMLNVLAHHFAGRGFPIQAVLVWLATLAVNVSINVLLLSHGTYVAALSSTVAYLMLLVLYVRMFASESGSLMTLVPRRADCADLMRVLGRLRLPSGG
jgi:O-antigen/teichoic acid export membrane protein